MFPVICYVIGGRDKVSTSTAASQWRLHAVLLLCHIASYVMEGKGSQPYNICMVCATILPRMSPRRRRKKRSYLSHLPCDL